MDLSALIFVALAVAWAVYLVPKALKHHDEVQRSRSVERFSASMRVLARREPVNRRDARLVVTPSRRVSIPLVHTKARGAERHAADTAGTANTANTANTAEAGSTAPVAPAAAGSTPAPTTRRTAAARAARRRRRVLGLVVLGLAAVAGVAAFGMVSWAWTAVPGGLLVAWLVACRLMARSERRVRRARPVPTSSAPARAEESDPTGSQQAVVEDETTPEVPTDPDAWDMVPPTLPTYVSQPAAVHRTVQTIDLDSTGVWTSGRHAGDSALAREAEEAERVQRAAREATARRVAGS